MICSYLQYENTTTTEKARNSYAEMACNLSHHFYLGKPNDSPGLKIFFIQLSLSTLVTLLRVENALMSFLKPKFFQEVDEK